MSEPMLDEKIMTVVVHKLTGECHPYGDTSIDEDRKENLKVKIAVAESLLKEIVDAGKLYNRSEFSIQDISNMANQWLVDIRDWLNDIDYLPKPYKESEEKMTECCGTCKYHKHESIDSGWVCVNPESEYCTDWTEYNDWCIDWERRE